MSQRPFRLRMKVLSPAGSEPTRREPLRSPEPGMRVCPAPRSEAPGSHRDEGRCFSSTRIHFPALVLRATLDEDPARNYLLYVK